MLDPVSVYVAHFVLGDIVTAYRYLHYRVNFAKCNEYERETNGSENAG